MSETGRWWWTLPAMQTLALVSNAVALGHFIERGNWTAIVLGAAATLGWVFLVVRSFRLFAKGYALEREMECSAQIAGLKAEVRALAARLDDVRKVRINAPVVSAPTQAELGALLAEAVRPRTKGDA